MMIGLGMDELKTIIAERFGVSNFDVMFYDGKDKEIVSLTGLYAEVHGKSLSDVKCGKNE